MNLPVDASNDQSNCPPDYYRRSNGMLHQIPANNSVEPSTDIDLTRLEQMSREELLGVVKRSNGIVEALNDDQLRAMAKDKLSALLQSIDAKSSPSLLLSVAREVLDRLEGKPTQRIEQKVEHSSKGVAGEMTNEQLMVLLRKADDAKQLPNGMRLLDDGMLVTDATYQEVSSGNTISSS